MLTTVGYVAQDDDRRQPGSDVVVGTGAQAADGDGGSLGDGMQAGASDVAEQGGRTDGDGGREGQHRPVGAGLCGEALAVGQGRRHSFPSGVWNWES